MNLRYSPIQSFSTYTKKNINFCSKKQEKNPIVYGINYDTVDFSQQQVRGIGKLIQKNLDGDDISATREALIYSRMKSAIMDAEKFIAMYPQFEFNDICQDLILLVINSTNKELNGKLPSGAMVNYASKRVPFQKEHENIAKAEQEQRLLADLENERQRSNIYDALTILKPREADIIIKYYGIDGRGRKTLEQIGNEYNISRERVREIIGNAEKKLRKCNS